MNTRLHLVALAAVFALATPALHAQDIAPPPPPVPQLINYQGRIAVVGVNFNGTGQFKFALVDPAGAVTYWSNDGSSSTSSPPAAAVSLTVTNGLYSVLLGDTSLGTSMTAIPASVWTHADVRLRVWFNDGATGFQRLIPDQRLAPHGYLATGAVSSTAIGAGAVTNTQLAPNAVQAGNIAPGAVSSNHFSLNLTLPGTTTGTFTGDGSGLQNLNPANITGPITTLNGLILENRTDDPANAVIGRIWLRTDL